MGRRIWLHIGAEKTGTTSVQKYCTRNRAALEEGGLLYPQLGSFSKEGHWSLVGAVCNDVPGHETLEFATFGSMDEEWGELRDLLHRHPDLDVLLSAEHFSTRVLPAGIAAIARWFEDVGELDAVDVVVMVRRQDDLLTSVYAMYVLMGERRPFREFAEAQLAEEARRYDHAELLTDWAAVFGSSRVVAGIFEQSGMQHGVVPAFFDLLGRPELGHLDNADLHVKRAPSLEAVEAVRILNGGNHAMDTRERTALALAISSLGFTTPADRLLGAEERRALLSRYRDSNRQAAALVREHGDEPLFGDGMPSHSAPSPDEIHSLGLTALGALTSHLQRTSDDNLKAADEERGERERVARDLDRSERELAEVTREHDRRGTVLRRLAEDDRVPSEALTDAMGGDP